MKDEEVRAMLYLIVYGRDVEGDDEFYRERVQIIKKLVDRQQEEIKDQNEAIKKLATIIAEIAEIAETEGIEGKVMDILEEYL